MSKTTFAPEDVPLRQMALLQGLVLGFNCRRVVDTDFGCGYTAAAMAVAFDRLPGGAKKSRYLGIATRGEMGMYAFTYIKRSFGSIARHIQIQPGEPIGVLAGMDEDENDFGIVTVSSPAEGVAELVEEVARVVRDDGLICLRGSGLSAIRADQVREILTAVRGGASLRLLEGDAPLVILQNRK